MAKNTQPKSKTSKGRKSKTGTKKKSPVKKEPVLKVEPVSVEEPVAEVVVTEEPVAEVVVTEEPVAEVVVTEEPVVKKRGGRKSPSKKSKTKTGTTTGTKTGTTTETTTETTTDTTTETTTDTPVVKKPLTPRLVASTDVNAVPDLKLEDNISSQLDTLLTHVATLVNQLKDVHVEVKTLQKNYSKVLKDHNKIILKKKKVDRKPSGFAKPSRISEEMATFLSLNPLEEIPRNQVTKLINQYIIKNDLRNSEDKRQIQPNDELSKLLNLTGDENLSYFNLQKYMKHHFIKNSVEVS